MATTSSSWTDPDTLKEIRLPEADIMAVSCPKYGSAMLSVCQECPWHAGFVPVPGNEALPSPERWRVGCNHPVKRFLRPVFGLSHPVVSCPLDSNRVGGRMGSVDPQNCQDCQFFRGYGRRPANRMQKLFGLGLPCVVCAHATNRRFDLV